MTPIERAREAAREAWVREFVNGEPIHAVPILSQAQERRIDATLDAFLASLAEDGMVLVPRVATEKMLDAAVAGLERHTSETEYSTPLAVWSAMIQAAQGDGT